MRIRYALPLLLFCSAKAYVWQFDLQGQAGPGLLSGNETSGVAGTPGQGGETGAGITYDDVTNILTVRVGWGTGNGFASNLTGPATMAHIHGPTAASAPGSYSQAAGVLINLGGAPFTFNTSASAGSITGDSAALSAGSEADLLAGRLYVNVHTAANPSGEIRGNLIPAASNFQVINSGTSGFGTLRQALLNAAATPQAETITFNSSVSGQTITLADEIVVNDTVGVTVDASPLPLGVTLRGTNPNRLITVSLGATFSAANLTFTGGNGTGASFTGTGGAMLNLGTVNLTRCRFSANNANTGGALANIGNTAAPATVNATGCEFTGNTAITSGGAIFNQSFNPVAPRATLNLTRCTLWGNLAGDGGAGIHSLCANNLAEVALDHCTLSLNYLTGGSGVGGAIRLLATAGTCSLTATSCTISHNGAATGGGLHAGTVAAGVTSVSLTNTILSGNTATSASPDGSGGATSGGRNFIGNNSGLTMAANTGDQIGTAGNPLDARLGELADHGGPVRTQLPLPGSPVVDGGVSGSPYDSRYWPRAADGDGNGSAIPDIGAAELSPGRDATPILGFNLRGEGGAQLLPGDLAGWPAARQGNWNNLASDSDGRGNGQYVNGPTPLKTAAGSSVSLRLWWDSPNVYNLPITPATPNEKLMWGYLDSNAGANGTVTDLTNTALQPYFGLSDLNPAFIAGGYDVLVYTDGDVAVGRVGEYWLSTFKGAYPRDISTERDLTRHYFARDNANFAGTFTPAPDTATNLASAADANLVIFKDQLDTALLLRTEEGNFRAPINAVQLVRNPILTVTTARDELDAIGPDGTGLSLREALRDVPAGGGIVFDPTVFNGTPAAVITNALGEFVISKDVMVDGSVPAGFVELRGYASGGETNRHFSIAAGVSASLRQLVLKQGGSRGNDSNSGGGGSIHSQGRLRVVGCRFEGNWASSWFGGAIYANGASAGLVAESCVFANNVSRSHGGALNLDGPCLLEDCAFLNNASRTGQGGGIHLYAASGVIQSRMLRCEFRGNVAEYHGGALVTGHRLTAEDCWFDANQAKLGLSGAAGLNQRTIVRRCAFSGNTAQSEGGAVWVGTNAADTEIVNSTVHGNQAGTGGGIRTSVSIRLLHCTITDNVATNGAGGGVWFNSSLAITNTIVAANSATAGGNDLFKSGAATVAADGNNLIRDNDTVATEFPAGPLVGTTANPLNPMLGPLRDNGGYAPTRAPLLMSPARNNAVDMGGLPATDARGLPRILGWVPDIGALEEVATYAAPHAADGSWNVYLVGPPFLSWTQAEAYARSLTWRGVRGHLVAVQSPEENEFVRQIAGRTYCWLGLNDNENHGGSEAGTNPSTGWAWMGGESGAYRNWAPGNPDNFGAAGEDAVGMLPDGTWCDFGMGAFGQVTNQIRGVVVEFETRDATNPWEDSASLAAGTTWAQPTLPYYPIRQGCGASEGRFLGTHLAGLALSPRHLTEAGRVLSDQGPGGGLQTDGAVTRVNLADPENAGGGGAFTGDTTFIVNNAGDDDHFATVFRAHLRITPALAGPWTFQLRGDDGCALRIVGGAWEQAAGSGMVDPADPSVLMFPEPTADAYTFGVIHLSEGEYELEYVGYEYLAGAFTELSAAPGIYPAAANYKLVGDPAGLPVTGRPAYLQFNGVNDYLEINDPGVLLGQNFTQEAWIYPQHTDAGFHGVFGHNPAGGAAARAPSMWVHNHRRIHYGFGTGSSWQATITPTDVLTTNAWNHVAITHDDTITRLYVNGLEVHTFTPVGQSANTPVKWIGRVDNFFKGRMDEVRMWTVARTQVQIQADMHRLLTGSEPGLAAYWRMDVCDSTAPPSIGPAWTTTAFGAGLSIGAGWLTAPSPVYNNIVQPFTAGSATLVFFGLPGTTYRVFASDEVTRPAAQWTPLGISTADTSGIFNFTDPAAAGLNRRYYRIQSE